MARYAKKYMPLGKVKDRQFLARTMGCKAVGISLMRLKPGEGASYVHRHKVQEEVFVILKGTGTLQLDGRRHKVPEGTVVRVGPTVYRAMGNTSRSDLIYMVLGAIPPKNFPKGGRTLLGDGIPNRKRTVRWKKK
ncbi:MAG: cupin domain-containing protein [Deltaproteobacteria bacterium]|nr:cupin domain-containing protein [Deltaproteobacteria bacterium]